MNDLVSLPKLVAMLSSSAGVNSNVARQFISEFTSLIADALAAGEEVHIKGIGIFCRANDKRQVRFIPDHDLAQAINAPFSVFDPVAIGNNVTEEMLDGNPEPQPYPYNRQPAPAPSYTPQPQPYTPQPAYTPQPEPYTPQPAYTPQPEPYTPQPAYTPQPEPYTPQPAPAPATDTDYDPDVEEQPITMQHPRKRTFNRDEYIRRQNDSDPKPEPKPKPVPEEPKKEEPYRNEPKSIELPWNSTDNDKRSGTGVLWPILACLFGLIAGIAIGFFFHDQIENLVVPQEKYDIDLTKSTEESNPLFPENTDDSDDTTTRTFSENLTLEQAQAAEEAARNAQQQAENTQQPSTPAQQTTPPAPTPAPKPELQKPSESHAAKAPEQPKPAKTSVPLDNNSVYVTVQKGTSLASLAREYYGNEHYWVYIYKENAAEISNPDNLRLGARLHIPPFSKYAADPNDPDTNLAMARQDGVKIKANIGKTAN